MNINLKNKSLIKWLYYFNIKYEVPCNESDIADNIQFKWGKCTISEPEYIANILYKTNFIFV